MRWLDEKQQTFEYRNHVIRAKRGGWQVEGTDLRADGYGEACLLVDRLIRQSVEGRPNG